MGNARSAAINSSNGPVFLNSQSRQAVSCMSESLAADLPTNQGLPLDHLPGDAEAELGPRFAIDTAGLTPAIHQRLAKSYAQGKERILNMKKYNRTLEALPICRPNYLIPQVMIDITTATESTEFYYLVAVCAYGTLEYVKSIHQAFQKTKDPLPKMLDIATFYNRPEIAEYCIDAGARVTFRNPYDLNKTIVAGHFYETFKVLLEHGLDINSPIEYFGDILDCGVESNNLDWVRFCLENYANPALDRSYSGHLKLAIVATFASIEISRLLIAWGAKIEGSSALTIASHKGRADLVKLLLENGANVNEMGVASIDDNPEDLEGTALYLIEKGRKDILQILLDHGGDVNQKDCTGKKVIAKMDANRDEVLCSMVEKNGGLWR